MVGWKSSVWSYRVIQIILCRSARTPYNGAEWFLRTYSDNSVFFLYTKIIDLAWLAEEKEIRMVETENPWEKARISQAWRIWFFFVCFLWLFEGIILYRLWKGSLYKIGCMNILFNASWELHLFTYEIKNRTECLYIKHRKTFGWKSPKMGTVCWNNRHSSSSVHHMYIICTDPSAFMICRLH